MNTMRGLWTPKDEPPDRNRISVARVGDSSRLLFTFRNEGDWKWAINRSSWSFDKALLALAVTDGCEDPLDVDLATQFF